MAISDTELRERPVCPTCGHENIPGASFCGRCGTDLKAGSPSDVAEVDPATDTQATSAYEPVASGEPATARSPWAPPVSDGAGGDAGQTSALPTERSWAWSDAPVAPVPAAETAPHRPSPRGFVLGLLAVLLIAAVLAVYVYAAWLGDAARDTVDGWLPWMR